MPKLPRQKNPRLSPAFAVIRRSVSPLERFLDPSSPSLKICGITSGEDADGLVNRGVEALGVNFWESSKRFCPVARAREFLPGLAGRIVRVGVFVNADPALPRSLLEEGLLGMVNQAQLEQTFSH